MYLDFISDDKLEKAVKHVFDSFKKAVDNTDIHKNTLDPFSAFFDGKRFYALASGDEDAMEKVFDILPKVVEKIGGKKLSQDEAAKFKEIFNLIF